MLEEVKIIVCITIVLEKIRTFFFETLSILMGLTVKMPPNDGITKLSNSRHCNNMPFFLEIGLEDGEILY